MDELERQLREQLAQINEQIEPLMNAVLTYQDLQGRKRQVLHTLELVRLATLAELQAQEREPKEALPSANGKGQ